MRKVFRWGKSIPDDIFRHFVLPLRVNNENFDYPTHVRYLIYCDLKERVVKMTIDQAALEINHWYTKNINL